MNIRKILEKIVNINPKMLPKYNKLLNQWWRVPEEDHLIAELGMRIYLALSILCWVIASISILFVIVNYTAKNSFIGWVVSSVIFIFTGFSFLSSSNEQKELYEKEFTKYKNAKQNKTTVDRRMTTIFKITQKEIKDELVVSLQKAISLNKFVDNIDNILFKITDSQTTIREIYRSNKVYEFNVNEIKEIESFSIVDSFVVYDSINGELDKISTVLYSCKNHALNNDDDSVLNDIHKLMDIIPDFDEQELKQLEEEMEL